MKKTFLNCFFKLNEELIEIKSNLLDLKNILCEFVQNNNRTLNDSGKKEVVSIIFLINFLKLL